MARYTSAKSRDGAVQDYLQLRAARDRSIAGRRALAAAEASLAEELRATGRHITDDGMELSVRGNGRIATRQVNTEVRQPRVPGRRAIERARRYGFEGSDEELRAKGREIRQALRSLDRTDVEAILTHARERLEASLADDDDDDFDDTPAPSPAKSTPTPTPKATSSDPTGWGADGVFRATRSQLRDPAWAIANQQSLSKAGAALVLVD
jgi:hypothetical protein